MDETTFIYGLRCPISGEIRYVGKSNDPQNRYQQHLSTGNNAKKDAWVQWLKFHGKRPRLIILEECARDAWRQVENEWREFFVQHGCWLTNGIYPGYDREKMLERVRDWRKVAYFFWGKCRG